MSLNWWNSWSGRLRWVNLWLKWGRTSWLKRQWGRMSLNRWNSWSGRLLCVNQWLKWGRTSWLRRQRGRMSLNRWNSWWSGKMRWRNRSGRLIWGGDCSAFGLTYKLRFVTSVRRSAPLILSGSVAGISSWLRSTLRKMKAVWPGNKMFNLACKSSSLSSSSTTNSLTNPPDINWSLFLHLGTVNWPAGMHTATTRFFVSLWTSPYWFVSNFCLTKQTD